MTTASLPRITIAALLGSTDHNNHGNDLKILFSEIFRQQEQRLYTLALRLTKSDPVAKDIIQEVFLKLWEQGPAIYCITNVEAWLYRVTENKVVDFLRKSAADSRLKKAIWDRLQDIINNEESHLTTREYNEIIQKAIDQLPTKRRLIYQLNREEGLNYQQIADELQLSRHTVKNQLFSAVQTVRKFITRNTKLFSVFF